jgi:hypothetical protein
MAQITLDVPPALHLQVKQIQLKRETQGVKANLKEIYYEIIEKGLKQEAKENPS